VSPTATQKDIKKAHRRLGKQWHPDKHKKDQLKAEEMFKKIQKAYDVLSDPVKRGEYDKNFNGGFVVDDEVDDDGDADEEEEEDDEEDDDDDHCRSRVLVLGAQTKHVILPIIYLNHSQLSAILHITVWPLHSNITVVFLSFTFKLVNLPGSQSSGQ